MSYVSFRSNILDLKYLCYWGEDKKMISYMNSNTKINMVDETQKSKIMRVDFNVYDKAGIS
jgi:hypothetical protein